MRNIVLICAAAFLLNGCAPAPKNVKEFRDAMSKGAAFSKQETHIINRSFSEVHANVKRKSNECLHLGFTRSTTTNGMTHQSTMKFIPNVESTGKGKSALSIRMTNRGPKEGGYVFLADMETVAPNKTRMVMYGSSFPTWQPIFDAVRGWGAGRNVRCPDTP
jgi:hypothetical protein